MFNHTLLQKNPIIRNSPYITLLSGLGYLSYKYYNSFIKENNLQKLIILNNWEFHDEVLKYIGYHYKDQLKEFNYSVEKIYHFNEWRFRRKEKPKDLKIHLPNECNLNINYKNNDINISFSYVRDNNNDYLKLMSSHDCQSEEEFVTKIILSGKNKEILTEFVDNAKKWCDNETKKVKNTTKDTLNIYYYKKDYWVLLSKSPKRSLDSIYLKKDEKNNIMNKVNKFFSEDTRNIYLSFGIPYKTVNLIHGPPGTGKTSLIKSIASELDCDLYILPISKDMLDTNLVDAFSYIADNEEKERIIVIEDIDTLFDETRKEGDNHNGITLQAFLNCLDGFTCVEGTMLFLTANKPEVLDFAMIRSCRVDNKIKLDYADKFQTKNMFERFLPEQKDKFKEFYRNISHTKYTTAMLQEFLFYNREHENIIEITDKFIEIVDKNDPKKFEIVKDENQNLYC